MIRDLCVSQVSPGEAAHEKNVSTQQNQARPYPRVQGSHGHPQWPQGTQRTQGQGPQAADCLTESIPGYGFPRSRRLNTSGDFQRVFDDASKSADKYLTVLARANGGQSPRLGLAISKKQIRKASDRNRIKRLIRESFRLSQHSLDGLDFIVMARSATIQASHEALRNSLHKHWKNQVRQCKSSCSSSSKSTVS